MRLAPAPQLTTRKEMTMSLIDNLGYEQLKALAVLNKTPDIEGTALCKQADCSWDEMFKLAEAGLIDIGEARLAPKQLNPTLTDKGKEALKQALEALPSLGE
jgi:hypothetical protein